MDKASRYRTDHSLVLEIPHAARKTVVWHLFVRRINMKINVAVFCLFIATSANAALNAELSAWLEAHPNVKADMVWSGCSLTQAMCYRLG